MFGAPFACLSNPAAEDVPLSFAVFGTIVSSGISTTILPCSLVAASLQATCDAHGRAMTQARWEDSLHNALKEMTLSATRRVGLRLLSEAMAYADGPATMKSKIADLISHSQKNAYLYYCAAPPRQICSGSTSAHTMFPPWRQLVFTVLCIPTENREKKCFLVSRLCAVSSAMACLGRRRPVSRSRDDCLS
jgi:hypothetical protein